MTFRRGDVVLVRFPYSDFKGYKVRPALIVQDERVDTGLSQRLIASLTSNLARRGPSRAFIGRDTAEGRAMGLASDSMVLADHLATIFPRDILHRLGRCPSMRRVDAAPRAILGL